VALARRHVAARSAREVGGPEPVRRSWPRRPPPPIGRGEPALDGTDAPLDRPVRAPDARDLPPPEPLRRSPETLADPDDRTVWVRFSDRVTSHLSLRSSRIGATNTPPTG